MTKRFKDPRNKFMPGMPSNPNRDRNRGGGKCYYSQSSTINVFDCSVRTRMRRAEMWGIRCVVKGSKGISERHRSYIVDTAFDRPVPCFVILARMGRGGSGSFNLCTIPVHMCDDFEVVKVDPEEFICKHQDADTIVRLVTRIFKYTDEGEAIAAEDHMLEEAKYALEYTEGRKQLHAFKRTGPRQMEI